MLLKGWYLRISMEPMERNVEVVLVCNMDWNCPLRCSEC